MRNKKVIAGIAIGIILVISVLFLLGFSFFSFWRGQQQKDYIVFGDDHIPTINFVIGDRELVGISNKTINGATGKTYEYKSEMPNEDLEIYMGYLMEKEDFKVLNIGAADDQMTFAKESVNDGEIIIVQPYISEDGYKIMYGKGEGKIQPY